VHDYFKSLYPQIDTSQKVAGEEAHIAKWSGLGHEIDPIYYRVFYHLSGNKDPEFVPEYIHSQVVLKILNEQQYNLAYSDKNFYDQFYDSKLLPETILRRMNRKFLSRSYEALDLKTDTLDELLNGYDEFIVKPSIHSVGGKNVRLFRKDGSVYKNSDGIEFSIDFIRKAYPKDCILQERISQHAELAAINESSLNTLRIFTYKSVLDEQIKILGVYWRVGGEGADVDNVSSGGTVTTINESGYPSEYLISVRGEKTFQIKGKPVESYGPVPQFEKIIATAKRIARKNIHHRLLGLDLTVDTDNTIKFIEVNNGYIGCKDAQVTGVPLYGAYTDEIIEYCKKYLYKAGTNYLLQIGNLYLVNQHQKINTF